MFSQGRQEHIPSFVARADRLTHEQATTRPDRLPALLLQELRDQPPPQRVVHSGQQASEPYERHRLVDLAKLLHGQER
jgi:hypothetical protein